MSSLWIKSVILIIVICVIGVALSGIIGKASEGYMSSIGGRLSGLPSMDQIQTATDAHHGNTGEVGSDRGNKWDNYSHTAGDVSTGGGATIYYGGQGYTARLLRDPSGLLVAIEVIPPIGTTGMYSNGTAARTRSATEYYYKDPSNVSTYKSMSGGRIVMSSSRGHLVLQLTLPMTDTVMYMFDRDIYSQSSISTVDKISDDSGMDVERGAALLPQGIPKSEIPKDQEDLYILKTQIPQPMIIPDKSKSAIIPTQRRTAKKSGRAEKPWPSATVADYTMFGM